MTQQPFGHPEQHLAAGAVGDLEGQLAHLLRLQLRLEVGKGAAATA